MLGSSLQLKTLALGERVKEGKRAGKEALVLPRANFKAITILAAYP